MSFSIPVVNVRTQAEHFCMTNHSPGWLSEVQCLSQFFFRCQNISRCFYTGVFRQDKCLTLQTHQPGWVLGSCSRESTSEMYSKSQSTLNRLICMDVLLEESLQVEGLAKLRLSSLMHQTQCFFDFEYWHHISSVQYPSNTISNICF